MEELTKFVRLRGDLMMKITCGKRRVISILRRIMEAKPIKTGQAIDRQLERPNGKKEFAEQTDSVLAS